MRVINKYLQEESSKDSYEKKDSVKCIIKLANSILILRRAHDRKKDSTISIFPIQKPNWDLPGGGIDKEENKEDAIRREVKEETNLSIKNIKLIGTDEIDMPETGLQYTCFYYVADIDGVEDVELKPAPWNKIPDEGNRAAAEHTEFKWIKYLDEIDDIEMFGDMKSIVKKYLKKRKTGGFADVNK